MKSFKKIVWHGSLIALAAVSLAGCDDNHNPNNGGGGVIVKPQDQFGAAFADAFGADDNSEPKPVNDGDIVAVSLTSEPVEIR